MALILPDKFKKERPQTTTEIDGSMVVVFYDDDASKVAEQNQYAVFSKRGFHCWLALGFTQSELKFAMEISPAISYESELKEFVKRKK